ncbi:MAG TPA: adenylate/guanylate cyclase domain-containing protein [Acidimicrobiia bacterium]|nr:adenylate/guanylate cyclase domain-containing protein [Acidimicrobiia bacterium]
MATLDAKKRASLPNSAFAYVDSKGDRRLPIHDEAHVRNALARFNQVRFESDEAREKAFRRLLRAAAEYGIAPVGFVTRQIREAARSEEATELPSGQVTLLFTDMEGSTGLVRELGPAYPDLLEDVRRLIREVVERHRGYEVDARADEFFAAFARAGDAISAAVAIQLSMGGMSWPGGRQVRVRIGLHSGSPAVTDTGYVGLPVHVLARVASAGHGGQILLTAAAREELGESAPAGIGLTSLGRFHLAGLPEAEELLQVEADGLESVFPALRVPGPG